MKEGETLEQALRRFKRLIRKEGILEEYKSRQYYEKPSVKRRRSLRAAIRRQMRLTRKLQERGF